MAENAADNDVTAKAKSTHSGHRGRLRKRFLKSGADGLHDYELLELLLFQTIPRRDVKPLAKDLIREFGTLGGVLMASPAALSRSGLSENTAVGLKSVQAAAAALTREAAVSQPVLSNWQALLDYIRTEMAHAAREQFRVLFLDRKNKLMADEVMGEGTVDHAPVYPREVVKRALELSASAVILVHNHPSGDPRPSKGDIAMTRDVVEACARLDIRVHDHVIIAKSGHASFKSLGLI